ncbi:MAG: response regulator [Lewinellaceae bacterium]|nr:response regulator [Lewinellaceae bacterium]
MRVSIRLVLGLGFLLMGTIAFGVQPYTPEVVNPLSESWRWRHFPELEGKGVRCFVEDAQGRVWIGGNEGVIEYDGYQWKKYNEGTVNAGTPVEQLFAGKNNVIYAITSRGVNTYRSNTWTETLRWDDALSLSYFQVRELRNGNLMICTQYGVLEIEDGQLVRCFTSAVNRESLAGLITPQHWVLLPPGILENGNFTDISDVLEVAPGKLWFSVTLEGYSRVIEFSPQAVKAGQIADFREIVPTTSRPFGETQKMLVTAGKAIWFINRSTNIGIHQYNGQGWQYVELSDYFGGDEYTTDIVQTEDGAIWVGALGRLYTYKMGKWEMYRSPAFKIPANRLLLSASHHNSIWIGGDKSKIYRLDFSADRWVTYRNLNYQCDLGPNEQWFIEVKGRVVHRSGNNWYIYDETDGLMDAPNRIITTSKGQLWAAGSHQGVAATALFRNGRWERQLHPQLSWGIDYRAVFEARDGSLWFGGGVDFSRERGQLGGVLQLQNPLGETFLWVHHKYHENGLLQSNAYGIGQSPDGAIWIGGGSLYYFDGNAWQRPVEDLLRQYVNIVQSTDKLLLVGSRYYGVFFFDGKKWQHYDTESGLASNTLISIHGTEDGQIWAATENDICRFDGISWVNNVFPSEMNLNLEGGAVTTSSDGAVWVNKSSREWNRRGFSHSKTPVDIYQHFVTYRYFPDQQPPETTIDLFTAEVSSIGNTLVSWTGEDYLGDTPDSRLYYSYRLNNGEWSPFTTETHHTFLNLASGKYVLEVRARDLDLNIDPTPAVVEFRVLPPVWKQGWFISLVLAFLAVIAIFEYRVIKRNQLLERLNKSLFSLNEELRNKNQQVVEQQGQILEQNQALEKSYHSLEEQNHEIQEQANQLAAMVKQVEELSRSKLNFFTNISHELRTPLTLILGPLEQLQHTSLSLAETKRLLDVVERNALRLLKLINQLLELRRIETSTLSLNLYQSNLGHFLEEVTSLFDNLARERHIHLDYRNDCPNTLVAFDADKIEKILINLLSNAFKHTPAGGQIMVSLSKGVTDELVIAVQDTGEGISEEELQHIFERYYSAADDPMSSGIGLAYIKELIALHHCRIDVRSRQGEGTTFFVYLPMDLDKGYPAELRPVDPKSFSTRHLEIQRLLESPPKKDVEAESQPDLSNAPQVLVVDDNREVLEFLEGMLSQKYRVFTASSGADALQIAKVQHLDLVLSDVMMPGMDGLTFCSHLKEDFATSHIPVILLTAKNMEEHQIEGFLTGADDYITKPFNPELLVIRMENLLNQRQKLRLKFSRDFALQPKEVQLTDPDEELLQRLVEIMEEHISDADFNVNKMCQMVHLSHMHFIRKVKQLTGKKPIDLLKSYRLKRAKDLLRQQKTNIAEVAYLVGYDLPNSFSRAFKKEFGYSPTEYVEGLEQSSTSPSVN